MRNKSSRKKFFPTLLILISLVFIITLGIFAYQKYIPTQNLQKIDISKLKINNFPTTAEISPTPYFDKETERNNEINYIPNKEILKTFYNKLDTKNWKEINIKGKYSLKYPSVYYASSDWFNYKEPSGYGHLYIGHLNNNMDSENYDSDLYNSLIIVINENYKCTEPYKPLNISSIKIDTMEAKKYIVKDAEPFLADTIIQINKNNDCYLFFFYRDQNNLAKSENYLNMLIGTFKFSN